MQPTMTVSQCVAVVSEALEATFGMVSVAGEVSSYNEWNGQLAFFDIKDSDAVLSCMVPLSSLDTPIEVGMQVQVMAVPKITKKGRFNLTVRRVLPQGDGALHQAFELLKQTLAKEGIFSVDKKRKLTDIPRSVAVVTSLESAAYRDVLAILEQRSPSIDVFAVHTLVQGEAASEQIVSAIEYVNRHLTVDTLIVTRGGGSLEDLIAFNSESVVRAIAGSRTPTVVATGHERDTTLAEMAADVRAATPTDAANKASANKHELKRQIIDYTNQIKSSANHVILASKQRLNMSVNDLAWETASLSSHPKLEQLFSSLIHHQDELIKSRSDKVNNLYKLLDSYNPENVLQRGYSIVRKNGQIIDSKTAVSTGEEIVIQLKDGKIVAQVKGEK